MWSLFRNLVIFGALIVGALYFVPDDIKNNLTSLITKTVPEKTKTLKESLQGGLDSIILSPAQQREKLLNKLEADIGEIKKEDLPPKVQEIIADSETIIAKLKAKNNDSGLLQTAVNKVIGSPTATSTCP